MPASLLAVSHSTQSHIFHALLLPLCIFSPYPLLLCTFINFSVSFLIVPCSQLTMFKCPSHFLHFYVQCWPMLTNVVMLMSFALRTHFCKCVINGAECSSLRVVMIVLQCYGNMLQISVSRQRIYDLCLRGPRIQIICEKGFMVPENLRNINIECDNVGQIQ